MSNYVIQDTTLIAIGDAIRTKTGKSELLDPVNMPAEIEAIETGGGDSGLPDEAYVISGNCNYRFAYGGWDWFLEFPEVKQKLRTESILNLIAFINSSDVEEFPCDINITNTCYNMSNIFGYCKSLKQPPLIKGDLNPQTGNYNGNLDISYMFYNCHNLESIPHDYFYNFGGDAYWESAKNYQSDRSNLFAYCYKLRTLPDISMLKTTGTRQNSSLYYSMCNYCYSLDEIIDLPINSASAYTSNAFYYAFLDTQHLKRLTFETQEDGTPYTVNWKNQTIDLSSHVGYGGYMYASGSLPYDKRITDAETYELYKNDPDGATGLIEYSRYNHDSAVETINSLPSTTNTGCTIKFKGESGSATDGGAINTLTEEEIAVATAKGWTVTLT